MFKNYLIIGLRNIRRHKGYSFINISGLAIGITVCLLLFLWIQDELYYDRYHENANQIYRVVSRYESDGRINQFVMTPAPLAPALLSEFPEIEKAVRFYENVYKVGIEKNIFYEKIFFADPEIFDVFTFPLARGDLKNALNEPYTIIISEDIRNKYFGKHDPIGKVLVLHEDRDYKIAGVFKNIPRNSHFRFDFLASFSTIERSDSEKWGMSNFYTYILTSENFNRKNYAEKLPAFVEKYIGREARYNYKRTYPLQSLLKIHLHSSLRGEIETNTDIKTIYIFSLIALFILFIACLNYINLSTARSTSRAKEVGLRKVIGASKHQLVKQYLGEALLFAFLALPFAIILSEIFLPLFNTLSGKELDINYFSNFPILVGLIGIVFLVGLISGLFPAFYISALQPVNLLRGKLKTSSKVSWFRRSLVVSQFSISIIFIICTVIVFNQLEYVRNSKLGIEKEHIVNIPIYGKETLQKYALIKSEFKKNSSVMAASASSFSPGKVIWYQSYWREGAREDEDLMIHWIPVDHDFIDTFKIKLVEGRGFSKNFSSDLGNVYILNESAVKKFGWKSPVGKEFKVIEKGTVIGVVEDFNYKSLHQEIRPIVLYVYPKSFQYLSVRINPVGVSDTLEFLKNKWQEIISGQSFEYSFLDDDFDSLYKSELRLGKIFSIVTTLAIFIACLGLFGLAAFSVEQRTKEIGIRKILGSTSLKIVLLISKEYTRLVIVANLISWPISYYIMNKWLQNFAYRTHLGIDLFILSGLLAFSIALLTVSYLSIKAAIANPIKALRYE